MARTARGRIRGRKSNGQITNVRMVPEGEGSRSMRVERMIAAVKDSQSFTRILVRSQFPASLTTSAQVFTIGFPQLIAADEFLSMAGQFRTFKVSAMRFDVYDQNPTIASFGTFGTYHDFDNNRAPATPNDVIDCPDAKEIVPGTGKETYYWYPSGTQENGFYGTGSGVDWGGLAAYLNAVSAAASKYSIMVTYVVDFRART